MKFLKKRFTKMSELRERKCLIYRLSRREMVLENFTKYTMYLRNACFLLAISFFPFIGFLCAQGQGATIGASFENFAPVFIILVFSAGFAGLGVSFWDPSTSPDYIGYTKKLEEAKSLKDSSPQFVAHEKDQGNLHSQQPAAVYQEVYVNQMQSPEAHYPQAQSGMVYHHQEIKAAPEAYPPSQVSSQSQMFHNQSPPSLIQNQRYAPQSPPPPHTQMYQNQGFMPPQGGIPHQTYQNQGFIPPHAQMYQKQGSVVPQTQPPMHYHQEIVSPQPQIPYHQEIMSPQPQIPYHQEILPVPTNTPVQDDPVELESQVPNSISAETVPVKPKEADSESLISLDSCALELNAPDLLNFSLSPSELAALTSKEAKRLGMDMALFMKVKKFNITRKLKKESSSI